MKILYGVCGEGRGHAGRSFALAQNLLNRGHDVEVFTFDQGLDLFKLSRFPNERLHEIPRLGFCETDRGISIVGTIYNYLSSYRIRRSAVKAIVKSYTSNKPDLIITDFEPLLAKVARSLDVPLVTIDNQHKFLAPLREGFGYVSNLHNFLLGMFVRWYIGKADHHIITTFHKCRYLKGITRVDGMLREEFLKQEPANGNNVLVYLHRSVADKVLPILRNIQNEHFVVYGVSPPPHLCRAKHPRDMYSDIQYKQTSYETFVEDLANCKAVICSAGNQLLAESKYYRKKVLAIPIPCQEEQIINSRYVELENLGIACAANKLTKAIVNDFLNTSFPVQKTTNGVDTVVEYLEEHYG